MAGLYYTVTSEHMLIVPGMWSREMMVKEILGETSLPGGQVLQPLAWFARRSWCAREVSHLHWLPCQSRTRFLLSAAIYLHEPLKVTWRAHDYCAHLTRPWIGQKGMDCTYRGSWCRWRPSGRSSTLLSSSSRQISCFIFRGHFSVMSLTFPGRIKLTRPRGILNSSPPGTF